MDLPHVKISFDVELFVETCRWIQNETVLQGRVTSQRATFFKHKDKGQLLANKITGSNLQNTTKS